MYKRKRYITIDQNNSANFQLLLTKKSFKRLLQLLEVYIEFMICKLIKLHSTIRV